MVVFQSKGMTSLCCGMTHGGRVGCRGSITVYEYDIRA